MRRGHLDRARAEFHVHIVVRHDGDGPVHDGQDDILAHNILVPLVRRVDGHARVAEHGLRPRRRDREAAAAVLEVIADVPQVRRLILVFHLDIRKRRLALGAPVDDAAALIDEALVVQLDEQRLHRLVAALVHREALAVPVAGAPELFLLLHDAPAVLLLPCPCALEEARAADILLGQALLLLHLLDNLDLRRDRGVIRPRHPQGLKALHALEADEGVLDRAVQPMAHVQLPRDVGRRHDDAKRLLVRVGLRVEIPLLHPPRIDAVLHLGRVVGLFDLLCVFLCFAHDALLFQKQKSSRPPKGREPRVTTFFPPHIAMQGFASTNMDEPDTGGHPLRQGRRSSQATSPLHLPPPSQQTGPLSCAVQAGTPPVPRLSIRFSL